MLRKNSGICVLAKRVATVAACLAIDGLNAHAAYRLKKNDPCRAAFTAASSAVVQRSAVKVVETANFRICGLQRPADAAWCAEQLELLRGHLQQRWLGSVKPDTWSPKCDLVVHASAQAYLRQAGVEAEATLGASRIELEGGRVAARRIDVRADQPGWFDAVVPHELTHMILADEFPRGTLPAWADEGMAVLADTREKQALHLRDFEAGQRSSSAFRLASFVDASGYPSPERIPVFYGQSVSLVKYLVERGSPTDFVRFLHLAEKAGYDAALAEVYGLGGVKSLEHEWLASTFQGPNLLTFATGRHRDFTVAGALVKATTP